MVIQMFAVIRRIIRISITVSLKLMLELLCPLSPGLLIYGCYGMWHSTLELDALEQQAHASSYQRYDDQLDHAFSDDHDRGEQTYQGWSAPEEGGYSYQQQQEDQDHGDAGSHHGFQSSRGRTNHGFDMGQED